MIVANDFYQQNYRTLDIATVEIQRARNLTEGDKTRTKVANTLLGLFAQDSWQLSPGLTVNLGLRYDFSSFFTEDKNNIAPRIGVAWDPWKDGKTVFRSGFGYYYDQNILELATAVPELGGLQFLSWSQQLIPRGASTFYNPAIGAYGPLQAGGTRWLANPKFFSYLVPQGLTMSSGAIGITGLGQPYIVYDLLGIPVADPRNPPLLTYNSISNLTNGRLTPEQAIGVLNSFFPGPGFNQFVWDETPPSGSIFRERNLMFKFREEGPGLSRISTLKHPTQTPYTRSFNVGVERQILTDMSADVQVFIRRGRDLLAARVINLRDTPVSPSCRGNTIDGGPCIKENGYIGFLDSNVLTMTLKKRMSHHYEFLVNYSYTDATDNFSTLRVPPPGQQTNFLLNNQPELDIGRSLNTPNHVFVASSLWQAPLGIDVGAILKRSSGSPFNAAGGSVDSDGDEQFDNRLIGTDKGQFETDRFLQLDVRVAKEFGLGGSRRVQFVLDIFNLTNEANPLRFVTAFGSTIGQTVEPKPGRETQIGFRVDF